MKQKFAEQDLLIFQKLFIPETSEVDLMDSRNVFEIDHARKYTTVEKAETKCLITSGIVEKEYEAYETIIQFDSSKGESLKYRKDFRCIQIGGAVRWVYPKGRLNTVFDFYHTSTLRSKLLKFGMKTLAALRLDFLISRKLTIHSNTEELLQKTAVEVPFTDFSIFMGTPGVERTVLVSLLNNKKSTAFLKMGMNSLSAYNVGSEGLVLFRLNRSKLEHIVVPTVKSTYHRGVVAISKLTAPNMRVSNAFQKQHVNALLELASLSRTSQHFNNSVFGETIADNCAMIEKNGEGTSQLGKLLLESFNGVKHDRQFYAGLAHGDFTPWNMFIAKDKLYLYDWELSIRYAPSLFDLFHFHFLAGIYLKDWSFNEIYAQIKFTIESHEELQDEIQRWSIDVKQYLELYLLHIVSRKMTLKIASGEKEALIDDHSAVWCDALLFVLPARANSRVGFITEFEGFLSGVEHAFLKLNLKSLQLLPTSSDLDIAIEQSSVQKTIRFCKDHHLVKRCRFVKKSFMTTLELFFMDGGYLSVDLIHDFRRKWLRFMDIRELLYFSSKNKNGISVPALEHDMEYALLFYTLNGASVPEKYLELFDAASRESKLRALRYFQKKYVVFHADIRSLLSSFELNKSAFELYFIKESSFSLSSIIVARWNYLVDTIKEKIGRRGFMLTVSGVDGVGKSTVIDLLKEQLEAKYRKEVVLMRHRPKVLPILSTFKYGSVKRAESESTHLKPNDVSKKSTLASYLRFFYYYFDYVIGQFYVHVRYVWGGKIVLYDRYYFDLINHPQRTNLEVNRKFAKWLYNPIIKPEMNIFLNASPAKIARRKQELTQQQITKLSGKYLSLFRELSRKYSSARYVVHRNDNLSKTVSDILIDIQQIA